MGDDPIESIRSEIISAIAEGRSARDKIADNISSAKQGVERTTGLIEKAKDNVAWLLGLPTALGGAFGFMWESSTEEATLQYQVAQLEAAVADLKAEGDLLGGGVKNWSLDPSAAPGGSLTAILVGLGVVILLGLLFWYQSRRRRQ
tara:strand:- start:609 stop:1046 length:438 start_codon:yes stop_codon:yes gene_type:complete